MRRDEGTTWKKSATMSLSAECGPAVVAEWYASLPKHYTVRVVATRMYLWMETQRMWLAAEHRL